jgi:Trk K+ transport system NAD-binding subunit
MDHPNGSQPEQKTPYVVIAGYGLPGRSLVEFFARSEVEVVVIEQNPHTCERAAAGGTRMVVGNAADPEVLRQAGVERATLVALMVPNDEVVLAAIPHVRRLNPHAHIIARCAFTSTGLEAMKRGADQSIVAEQVIAQELRTITSRLYPSLRRAETR